MLKLSIGMLKNYPRDADNSVIINEIKKSRKIIEPKKDGFISR